MGAVSADLALRAVVDREQETARTVRSRQLKLHLAGRLISVVPILDGSRDHVRGGRCHICPGRRRCIRSRVRRPNRVHRSREVAATVLATNRYVLNRTHGNVARRRAAGDHAATIVQNLDARHSGVRVLRAQRHSQGDTGRARPCRRDARGRAGYAERIEFDGAGARAVLRVTHGERCGAAAAWASPIGPADIHRVARGGQPAELATAVFNRNELQAAATLACERVVFTADADERSTARSANGALQRDGAAARCIDCRLADAQGQQRLALARAGDVHSQHFLRTRNRVGSRGRLHLRAR